MKPMHGANDKVQWRGHTFDYRTVRALNWVERESGIKIVPSNGSFNTSVDASGTTHAGAGAVDCRIVGLTDREVHRLVKTMKDAGFAVWLRKEVPGLWGAHVHGVLHGTAGASRSAKWQMAEFDAGRNGLTNQGADRSYRPSPPVRFDFRKDKPVPR